MKKLKIFAVATLLTLLGSVFVTQVNVSALGQNEVKALTSPNIVSAESFTQCSGAPLIWPTYGKRGWYIWNSTTSYQTQDGDYKHDGVDILQVNQQENVEPVYAAHDGYLTWVKTGALRLDINIASNYDVPVHHVYLYYAHMADNSGENSYILPKYIGATHMWVNKGDLLGKQGRKGTADELVHLHISVSTTASESGNIDPTKYFGDINLDASNGGTTDGQTPPFRCKNGTSLYDTGSLGGVVSDANGTPLQYTAYLNLISNGTTYSAWSGVGGAYSFENIPSGTATLKAVDNQGNSVAINNVSVVANFSKVLNIRLNNSCVDASTLSAVNPVLNGLTASANDCSPIQYPASGSACSQKSDGLYCGSSLGLNANSLYRCSNGSDSLAQVCSYGCSVQPAGTDDFCSPPPSGGSSCPNNENGYYCGAAVGLDSNTLYYCQNGVSTTYQYCSLGCIQKPPGTADVCRTSTSGGSCPAGNGDYCGSTLGLDPNTLFSCNNGNISIKQQCSNGCQLNPPGTADACYPPGSGGGGNTGSKVVLYGDSNYGANTIRVQVGIGDTDEPNRGAAYKSMSIPSGWSVILSDAHLGQVGNTKCYSQSQPLLESEGWAFSIESMRVYGTNVCPADPFDGIKICRETGQKNCMVVTQDIPSLNNYGFGNDTLKSVELGGSWELVLFEDDGYGGKRFITGSINDMGGTPFGYGASSLQVRKRDPSAFTLYHLGDYNGGEQFRSDRTVTDISFWDSYTTPSDQKWNDNAQSIRVASGYEVVACTDAGFHGVCGRTNHDNGDLNSVAQGLRNGLSSVQVCLGNCAPTSVPPVLISPGNGASYGPATPITLSWTGNGTQYLLEYWGGNYGNNVQSTGWRDGMLATTLTNLPVSASAYQWRVRSWTSVGDSGWSPTYTFKIQDVAPVQVYINGAVQTALNTDQTYTALVSPSNAVGLQYSWSPAPKSGQGTASVVYNWGTAGSKVVSVTVQNSGGSAVGSFTVEVQNPSPAPILNQIPGQTIGQSGSFQNINLGNYVTNLAQQSGLTWQVSGNNHIYVSIANNIATLLRPNSWSGSDTITFTARNSSNQQASSTAVFTVNGPVSCGNDGSFFKAEYFNNTSLTGTPVMSRCELKVDYDWAYGSPDPLVIIDGFSARWTTTLHVSDAESRYTFTATADDGVRLYIDSALVIDQWILQGETAYSVTKDLPIGDHAIKMEYFEAGGAGVARLNWQFNHVPMITQIPGQTVNPGKSFANINLNNYASDQDNDPLTWSYSGNTNIAVNIANNIATLTYPNNWTGSESITFTVTDPKGANASTSASFAVVPTLNCPAGQYAVYYFNNIDLSGSPAVSSCDASIKHNWGTSAPAAGISRDNFSVRWIGNLHVPVGGIYNFTAQSDEGIKVYVDGALKIDHWVAHRLMTDKVNLNLSTGDHAIKVEYYEKTGAAVAILTTTLVNKPPVVKIIPGQAVYQGQSFNAINLADYGSDPDIGDQVTWSYSGNTNISVSIVNNVATLTYPNIWVGKENITFKATDKYGASAIRVVGFKVKIITSCPVGQYKAQYFNNTTLSGVPAFTRCEGIPQYEWNADSPLPGINADMFSVRWTATVKFASTGYYRFTTSSDDGVRLYIDNVRVINNWTYHSWTDDIGAKKLAAGNHVIKMEYFEYGGGAIAKLAIAGPGHAPAIQPIPVQNITNGQGFGTIGLGGYINDVDVNDSYNWSIVTNGKMITGSVNAGQLSITTPANWIGTDYITVQVVDSFGLSARAKLTFQSHNPGSCAPGLGNYCVDYYSNASLSGTPVLTRIENAIAHSWGTKAPAANLPADNFSARWQGNIKLAAGLRKFTITSDNGARLYVDGNLAINSWTSHTSRADVVKLNLAAGYHLIQMEYYDATGVAVAKLVIQ